MPATDSLRAASFLNREPESFAFGQRARPRYDLPLSSQAAIQVVDILPQTACRMVEDVMREQSDILVRRDEMRGASSLKAVVLTGSRAAGPKTPVRGMQ